MNTARLNFSIDFCCVACIIASLVVGASSCKSPGSSGSIFSSDETAEAAKIVSDANADLTKIKLLYKENENKREELKNAMKKNDAQEAKKVADEIVVLIDEGSGYGRRAVEKIQQANAMQI